jgi:hypothetical protein
MEARWEEGINKNRRGKNKVAGGEKTKWRPRKSDKTLLVFLQYTPLT